MSKALVCLNYTFRIQDNPLFVYCAKNKLDVVPFVFLTEKQTASLGAAEKLWLDHALQSLNNDLDSSLLIFDKKEQIKKIIDKEKISKLVYSFATDPRTSIDIKIFDGLEIVKLNASNALDFDEVRNKSGGVFKVFTPFYKHSLTRTKEFFDDHIKDQLSNDILKHIKIIKFKSPCKISDLELIAPNKKWNQAWQDKMLQYWNISEQAAREMLNNFAENTVTSYAEDRDFPNKLGTSKLSCYLHFGMISPFRIWYEIQEKKKSDKHNSSKYEPFLRQLFWREFAQYILYYFPSSDHKNLNEKFDNFPWKKNKNALEKWKFGLTGYPIVDAGMRQLYETGWMHNRVRMIVGSFLVKDLMIHWHEGAKWFEDTLFDADLPNNSMGWQWVGGSGVDASPYFRIFNPITQSEKFDKNGDYIRKWIPELRNLDKKWIHKPFEAPPMILEAAGITLGKDYPEPLVNHNNARLEALAAFKSI